MFRFSIVLLFFYSLTSLAMQQGARVLVVGAGPAGLAAAERLMARNFNVKVFEKAERVGGKCLTIPCKKGTGVVELGAIQVGIGYPKVNAYRKAIGMKLRKYWPSQSLRYDDTTRAPIYTDLSEEYWPLSDKTAIAREGIAMKSSLARFKEYNDAHFVNLDETSEFNQPFEQWANSHNLDHYREDYRVWVTSYGYGHLYDVPAFLPLSLINSSFGLIFMRRFDMNLRMLKGGYGGLLQGMVDHYGIDVHPNTIITDIDRKAEGVRVTYAEDGAPPQTETFDHLVLACGMSAVKDLFGKDQLSNEERVLVENLHVSPYDVVIAYIPGLKKGGYVVPQLLTRAGHVSLISKNSSGGDEVILYVPRGGTRDANGRAERPSEDLLKATVQADMARFGFDDVEILHVQYWDNYFEHWVDPSHYRLLDSIQGQQRTVYVGAMARFEIVERAMEHAHDVIDTHILGEAPKVDSTFTSLCNSIGAFCDYLNADAKDKE